MPATNYNLTFYAGDTEYLRLQYLDANNNIIELASGIVQIKKTLYETTSLVTCFAVIDEDNTANFTFTTEMTGALRPTRRSQANYVYDAQITTKNGDVKTLVNGTLTVTHDVTESGSSIF